MTSRYLFLSLFLCLTALCFAQDASGPVDSLYAQGTSFYYDDQDYQKARASFLQALDLKLQQAQQDEQLMKIYVRLGKSEGRLRLLEDAEQHYKAGLKLAERLFGADSFEFADLLFELGNIYSSQYRPRLAIETFKQSLTIQKEHFGAESEDVAALYMTIGYSLTKMSSYEEAEAYYQQAFDLIHRVSDPEKSKAFYRIYSYLGNLYRYTGDYDRAINYLTKSLELKAAYVGDENDPTLDVYYRNLARAYELNQEPEKALPLMQKSAAMTERHYGPEHSTRAGALGELGNIYADLGQYEKALDLYRESRRIQDLSMPPTHPYVIATIFNIATVYEDMERYEAAIEQYKIAADRFKAALYTPPHDLADVYYHTATNYLGLGKTDEALDFLQSSMALLVPGYDRAKPAAQPDLNATINPVYLLRVLEAKAECLKQRYLQEQDREALSNSFETLELAVALIEKMKKGYSSEVSIRELQANYTTVFDAAIEQGYLLYAATKDQAYLHRTFLIAEKSKAGILSKAIRDAEALDVAGIPLVLLDSLHSLKLEIAGLEAERWTAEDDQLQTQLLDRQLAYEQLIQSLERSHPDYYALKYGSVDLRLSDVQQRLPKEGTAVLSYYYSADALYAFLVKKSELQLYRQDLTGLDLSADISTYRAVNLAVLNGRQLETAAALAPHRRLYELFIAPLKADLDALDHLVIIPHGAMYHVAFETLLPEADGQAKALAYLLRSHQIDYAWSAALWAQGHGGTSTPEFPFAGFAPKFGDLTMSSELRAGLMALPFARKEIEAATRVLSGLTFFETEARESTFYEVAPRSRILHLATHALAYDENPLQSGLYFAAPIDSSADGYLSALEIYSLDLAADLVIISACNTGFGPIAQGEGVMNLGRAFTYAGSKAVLYSLWPANDYSSAAIFERFYEVLGGGTDPSTALRQAQLDYLEQADPLTGHPAFWGHLVLMGDSGRVVSTAPVVLWYWAAGVLVLGLSLLYLRRRNKDSTTP